MYEYTLIYIENRFWLLVVETAHYAIRVAATTYLDFKSTRLWLHLDSSSLCPILQRLTLRITSRRTPHTNVWNAYRAKIHARQRTGQAVNSLHIMEHQLNEHKVGLLVNHLWFQLTNLEKRIGTYVQSKPITPTTAVLFAPHHWLSTLHDTHNIDSTRPVVNEDKTSKKEMMKDGETLSWNVLHMLHLVFLAKVLGSPWGLSAGDWAPRLQSGEAWHALIELALPCSATSSCCGLRTAVFDSALKNPTMQHTKCNVESSHFLILQICTSRPHTWMHCCICSTTFFIDSKCTMRQCFCHIDMR